MSLIIGILYGVEAFNLIILLFVPLDLALPTIVIFIKTNWFPLGCIYPLIIGIGGRNTTCKEMRG